MMNLLICFLHFCKMIIELLVDVDFRFGMSRYIQLLIPTTIIISVIKQMKQFYFLLKHLVFYEAKNVVFEAMYAACSYLA